MARFYWNFNDAAMAVAWALFIVLVAYYPFKIKMVLVLFIQLYFSIVCH